MEGVVADHYTLHSSLWDVAVLSIPRILSALFAIMASYNSDTEPVEYPFDLYHKNGDKKSSAELEEEALEENCMPKFKRFIGRYGFTCEVSSFVTGVLLAVKAMARLNVEIGVFNETRPLHPVFWVAVSLGGAFVLLESSFVDAVADAAGVCGRSRRQNHANTTWMERISQSLTQPLLHHQDDKNGDQTDDVEQGNDTDNTDVRGKSDIGGDANYKAQWSDLGMLLKPDAFLFTMAMVFLVAAALPTIWVPRLTGKILDALVANSSDGTNDDAANNADYNGGSVLHVPGFLSNVLLLVLASTLGGVFGGCRGALFTIVSGTFCRGRLQNGTCLTFLSIVECTSQRAPQVDAYGFAPGARYFLL